MSEDAGMVLVVEDDDAVRKVIRRFLEQAGYRVAEAADGRQALAKAARHRGALALLVTDVMLPGISGVEVARELADQRPGVPVLFMSGHPHEDRVRYGAIEPGYHFMQKPIDREAFLAAVREMAGAPPG